MSFSQRQSWFKQNSGSMPEMTSHSPKENHSSTSSTQFVPCWVLTTSPVLHHTLKPCTSPKSQRLPSAGIWEHCLYLQGFGWSRNHHRKQPRYWGDSEQGHSFPSTLQLHQNSCSAPVSLLLWFISHRRWDSAGGPKLQPSPSASMGELPPKRQRHTRGKGWEAWHGIPSVLAINKIQLQQKGGWSPKCPAGTLDLLAWVVCTCHQFHEAPAKLWLHCLSLPCSPA